jgi:kinesin family protein 2/24
MKFRKSAPTFKNDSSSRSHAIWRIRITNMDVPETPDGLLFLIDLAGSEFARDYQTHTEAQKKDSKDINMSLSTLKECIRGRALQDKHIPYRHSALTKVLKHVFDPKGFRGCKTAVLACVNPSASDIQPSKNTLRFAELLKVPVPKPKPVTFHPDVPATWNNKQVKEWIEKNVSIPSHPSMPTYFSFIMQ